MQKTDELRTIVSFIQASQAGSFTQAAEVLGLTPAAVSKNVSTLEKSLGVRLFNRTTRSLSLTNEGRQFAEQAKIAVELLTQASENLRQANIAPQGKVKISLPPSIGRLYVVPHLGELQQRYPQIQLELDFDNRVIDFVQDGFDLVIRGGTIQDSTLISRKIAVMRQSIVASPNYLAQKGIPNRPEQLRQHQLLVRRFSSGKLVPWYFRQADGSLAPLELSQPSLVSTDIEVLADATQQGLGIAQLPNYIAHALIAQGKLQALLKDCHHSEPYELVLQYPHRALLAPRVKAVAEFLLEKLSQEVG